jgi:competence protein ComEA
MPLDVLAPLADRIERLPARLPNRWTPTARAAGGAALLALLVVLLAITRGLLSGPSVQPVAPSLDPPPRPTNAAVASSSPTPSGWPPAGAGVPASASATVVVDVVGRIRRAGLVELPGGARVADAVEAAGGALPGADLAALNLARRVVDGEQILVPKPGQVVTPAPGAAGPAAAGGSAAGTAASAGTVIDLNTATEADFDALPGIGPVLAARIVAWRTQHGRFSSVDELTEVSGIGEATMTRLRPLVRV